MLFVSPVLAVETKSVTVTTQPATASNHPSTAPTTYTISKDPAKCQPFPCTTRILKKEGNVTSVVEDDIKTTTTLPIKMDKDQVIVENQGKDEVVISPSEAVKTVKTYPVNGAILPTKTFKIALTRCEPKPGPEPPCQGNTIIYKVDTEKESKLLGIIPITSKVNYEVAATSGKVLTENKPWYLMIVPFLFKH